MSTSVNTSTTTLPAATVANLVPPCRAGLAELASSFAAESGKRLETMIRNWVDSRSSSPQLQGAEWLKESKDKAQKRTPSISPARKYALEIWV